MPERIRSGSATIRCISDQGIIRALAHPLRAQVLARLDQGEASPKELAAALGEKIGNVSYHVRILTELQLIELVRRTPRRGAVEHHYRSRPRPEATVSLELRLDAEGWREATQAIGELTATLADIAERHEGASQGRVVAAVLGAPAG